MKYAIAGVTGNTGKVVAERLLSAGHAVRVIVRDPAKGETWRARGAEVAVADLGDAGALAQALEGVDGAWLLVPPRMAPGFLEYQRATVESITEAVRRSQPAHVVVLSSIGAQHEAGTGPIAALHLLEQRLGDIARDNPAVSVTAVRAGYFMENLGASLGALEQGILPGFVPIDLPIEMIASRDIGRVAADALLEGGRGVQVIEIGGPGRTMTDAAEVLTRLVGKPIQAVQAPLDQMVPTLSGFGMPEEIASVFREMTEALTAGELVWEAGHRHIDGATGLDQVLGLMLSGGGGHA